MAHDIAQWTNCQQFGHSRNFCKRRPICVRYSSHDFRVWQTKPDSQMCRMSAMSPVSASGQPEFGWWPKKRLESSPDGTVLMGPKPSLSSFPPLPKQNKPIPAWTKVHLLPHRLLNLFPPPDSLNYNPTSFNNPTQH